jgi:hypothetical protein
VPCSRIRAIRIKESVSAPCAIGADPTFRSESDDRPWGGRAPASDEQATSGFIEKIVGFTAARPATPRTPPLARDMIPVVFARRPSTVFGDRGVAPPTAPTNLRACRTKVDQGPEDRRVFT